MKHLQEFETKSQFDTARSGNKLSKPWVSYIDESEEVFTTPPPYALKFTAVGESSTLGVDRVNRSPSLYISYDGENFKSWDYSTITLEDGECVYIEGTESVIGPSQTSYYSFTMTGKLSCKGPISSLYQATSDPTHASSAFFYRLFKGCTSLLNIPTLDITEVTGSYTFSETFQGCTGLTTLPSNCIKFNIREHCCDSMFKDCINLTNIPISFFNNGIKEIKESGCSGMFRGCTSLVNAPELPATTLAKYCYSGMFSGCTSLRNIPEKLLPATTLVYSCYSSMFYGCTSLRNIPEKLLPATTLDEYCYAAMFSNCTSLVNAPELPATTLPRYCYYEMFHDCTNLINAPELPATTLTTLCYANMFRGCTSLVNAPELPATTLASSCYAAMFKNCTSLVNAPELPATTLVNGCYGNLTDGGMFEGCVNLSYVKVLGRYWGYSDYPFDNWLRDVSPTGTIVKPAQSQITGIPSGWTIENI